ncbi:serine/threonine protein kinase [Streptomyces sp. NBC_01296]|uniref:serine/threonine protein kinase n=1 Tax=Streptomyces sp. NBC_01296 TaxID=2903816 RepID=UPI002E0E838C|nr:serine/threonine protein kinase [Streptomyces sp. NBC_01296]
MEDYAGRILADRYRLPLPPSDEYELVETRAFDTRSGQEVLVRQVPLPELVDAELLDGDAAAGAGARAPMAPGRRAAGDLPAVRRAIAAAQAAASVPDHPRLDQVFDVFAEGGSLWIVSELVPARPLAALIADEPLSPYRAAEVAADVLTALRVLHAHGWTHRNITVRTVLICEDGRVVLTGLAAGAAEDALCGYDPVPPNPGGSDGWAPPAATPAPAPPRGWAKPPTASPNPPAQARSTPPPAPSEPGTDALAAGPGRAAAPNPGGEQGRGTPPGAGLAVRGSRGGDPDGSAGGGGRDAGPGAGGYAPLVAPGYDTGPRYSDHITPGATEERPDLKAAARAGAIAAYRAGAQAAAARVTEQRRGGSEPAPEPRPQGSNLPQGYSYPYGGPETGTGAPWHGATPRRQAALPPVEQPEPEPGPESAPEPEPQPEPESPPEPEPQPDPAPPRPALPAQLALPQGYHQADPPPPASPQGAGGPNMASYLPPGEPDPVRQNGSQGPDTGSYVLPSRSGRPADQPGEAPRQGAGGPYSAPYVLPGEPEAGSYPHPGRSAGGGLPPGHGGGWGGGGIRSGLDAERARQTRMAVVGAVTERWAPEQAGSVSGPWQLAAPVGPATDLWALGALLYRAVQGHAPYPEDSVTELVEMVCAESPAFAEECGPLRPVVESLLRQDPTERPDFEELRGWLRSLVRSAPEPDGGLGALPMPEPDPARLPVVRRRGDLHGRHRNPAPSRGPRSLGRILLVGILALLAGAVAYAMLFLPGGGERDRRDADDKTPVAQQSPSPSPSAAPSAKQGQTPQTPQTAAPAPAPPGYTTQQDPEHFEIAVPAGWERRGMNEAGQVRYTDGEYVLTVVPGRDKVDGNPDPATYQKDKEPELAPYRSSTWASGGDVKTTKVGNQLRVTGRYTWIDGNGRSVVARNFVVALGGSYHVVMVAGPQDGEGKVTEVFEKATGSYKSGG